MMLREIDSMKNPGNRMPRFQEVIKIKIILMKKNIFEISVSRWKWTRF
jgi:hypothetical protein